MSSSQAKDPGNGSRNIFINYRRGDTPGDAQALSDRLKQHFGEDRVYFDVSQESGVDWLARIRERGAQSGAFLALIGANWVSEMRARSAARVSGPVDDVARREIEWALRDWRGVVIPVLIDVAMPDPDGLPRSIRGLCRRQAEAIRHVSFDRDVAHLIERLEQLDTATSQQAAESRGELGGTAEPVIEIPRRSRSEGSSGVPTPSEGHYREVAADMVRGAVVPWLGSCVRGSLPDSAQLAERLAEAFDFAPASSDLAEIAQHIAMRQGEPTLYQAMRELVAQHSEPAGVHRFLAAFPGLLRDLGLPPRPQLIVTTNYDRALEIAFEDANEPFEYAVYMPTDGHFVHFPWGENDAEPLAVPIRDPRGYDGFSIDEDYQLDHTVIVKLHGAPTGREGNFRWRDDYVVTEDQYIDYLPTQNIQDYLPVAIFDKLKASHCLFLGHMLRDWSTRVFFRRIWQGKPMSENSWSIEHDPDVLEKASWGAIGRVELLDEYLPDYVTKLQAALAGFDSVNSSAATGS